jgi:UDP-2-acetamido-3-amino-2,3-dideoxy-glucuronate N-acetyltransferase
MVGHLLHYHPGVAKLKEIVASPDFGKLEYIYSNRLNLGKIRTEENILWSFAPHDISIMLALAGTLPIQVTAAGGSYLTPNVADTTISTFVFDHGVRAHIYVSWLHPFKEQRLVVVGEKQMLTFDDQAPKGQKLFLHKKNVEFINGAYVAKKTEGVAVPFNEEIEPLKAECEYFVECMKTRRKPLTDGDEGLRVLTVLDACQRSLQMSGQPVQVREYRG